MFEFLFAVVAGITLASIVGFAVCLPYAIGDWTHRKLAPVTHITIARDRGELTLDDLRPDWHPGWHDTWAA